MRAAPALRQARHDGTLRMIEEARDCIARICAAAAPQLADGTRHAAQQLAELGRARVAALQTLPPHASETWIAAANVIRALEKIEAVISAPEAWAGARALFEAQHLLGAADAQAAVAALLAERRSKGGSVTKPDSKAEEIRKASAARPNATSGQIAAAVGADSRLVRKVKARIKR